jgi:diguanylate cyclase (GGDEF)-like protein
MNVLFDSGRAPAGAQSTTLDLHNGWTVQTSGFVAGGGIFADGHALTLLIGGAMLSVLLGLLIFVLGTGRTRALSLVREKTRELSYQALHDILTGLPNRALVIEHAEQMLARLGRQPRNTAAALFIDIDCFKRVNDNFGHAAGDQVLKAVAERLQSVVRAHDIVGRLGGDEFIVLLESAAGEAPPALVAERMIEVLRQPVALDASGMEVALSASVGVAIGARRTADELLRDADLALYAAKASGKDRHVVFEAAMRGDAEVQFDPEIVASEIRHGVRVSGG